MTNSNPLSPAAQVVLDAAFPVYDDEHYFTIKVEGLPWPEKIGNYHLMGPVNSLGAWRWYERNSSGKHHGLARVKVSSHLEAMQWVFNDQ
jgi:hypothetical protein